MHNRTNAGIWLAAGTILGAAGGYLAHSLVCTPDSTKKRLRRKTNHMANTVSRGAGEILTIVGHTLTNKR